MSHSRVFYVTGQKGYGKTALSATICKCYSTVVSSSHFFISTKEQSSVRNTVSGMIQAIASDLCFSCPLYQDYLTEEFNQNYNKFVSTLKKGDWRQLYDLLLKQPLCTLFNKGGACFNSKRRHLMVVDGLDECRPAEWANLRSFIEAFVKDLPNCFRLFVTTHSQYHLQLVPCNLDLVEGLIMENRAWINRHIKDIEVYLSRYYTFYIIFF